MHALPRSLRAPPPSNVVHLFFVPPPSAGVMGIAATSTLEGGGARNTSVWGNLTLLISQSSDKELPKSFRLISSRGDGFKLRSPGCAYVSFSEETTVANQKVYEHARR